MKEKREILCNVLEIKKKKKDESTRKERESEKEHIISYNEISLDKIYDLINACNKNFSKYIYR